MINKLQKKIFWLIQITLSIIVIGIIVLITTISYQNTINSSFMFLEKFQSNNFNNNIPKVLEKENEIDKEKENNNLHLDGIYKVDIVNNNASSKYETIDENIKNYSKKASSKLLSKGYLDNYVYSVKRLNKNNKQVTLIESNETIKNLKYIVVLGISFSIISLILIYIISKNISKIIVKPVEEVFNKQKEFISDASHELKTPLAIIKANVEVIETKFGENKWIKYIKNEITSMNKLVNDMLILTKTENVQNEVNEKINLSKEVEMAVSVFESIIFEKNIQLKTTIQENIIANISKQDIKQVISILLDNAIKHTNKGKKIEIKLYKIEKNKKNKINKNKVNIKNNIVIEVKNEGEEIKQEDREKIFERFYQVNKTRNRENNSYGLGLPILKEILKKYNSEITVDYINGFTIFNINI